MMCGAVHPHGFVCEKPVGHENDPESRYCRGSIERPSDVYHATDVMLWLQGTGAERYFAGRLADPEYAAVYEAACASLSEEICG